MSSNYRKTMAIFLTCALGLSMAACGSGTPSGSGSSSAAAAETAVSLTADDISINETLENSNDGEHVIEADGTEESYSNVSVKKTGDSDSEDADFYGENSAVFATNGATLNLSNILLQSDGNHANGIFSYGEGTTVNVSDSVIETSANCSGGLMTTGGGTMNASNLTIHTTGNSSAAIRSDRGGGTVTVDGGSYTTDGTGSPVIYSTADITVNDASMTSTASQGVVVEGNNSVSLNNVSLTADNNTKNSDKSDYCQAVMIYQSMSGDASEGLASFSMKDGTLTNQNGDIFFVNNTTAQIDLENAEIVNNDSEGVFLRAAAAGWGSEGSNGGQVTLNASSQTIDGNILVDEVSNLNLYLKDASSFTGAVNPDGQAGGVYVELSEDSTWTLTGDSYVTSLTCDADSINLNGHKLYVNGEEYTEGSASTGEAVELPVSSGGGQGEGMPEGKPSDDQNGTSGSKPENGGTPPEKPDGSSDSEHQRPSKPGSSSDSESSGQADSGSETEETDGTAESES